MKKHSNKNQEITFTERVVDELATRGVVPVARWKVVASRVTAWIFAIVSIVIGAVAFAVAEFVFFDNDGVSKLQDSLIQNLAETIPVIWLSLVALFSGIAYYGLRLTHRGYRYTTARLVAGVVVLSITLGILLNYFDFGQAVHQYFTSQIPNYTLFMPILDRTD